MTPQQSVTVDSLQEKEYIACDVGTIVAGVQKLKGGQVARLRFKSYGRPVAGRQNGPTPSERVLYARAVNAFPYPSDPKPTIVFTAVDDEETYVWAPSSRFETMPTGSDGGYRLARQEPDTFTVVGVNVAFSVPVHGLMSPHVVG